MYACWRRIGSLLLCVAFFVICVLGQDGAQAPVERSSKSPGLTSQDAEAASSHASADAQSTGHDDSATAPLVSEALSILRGLKSRDRLATRFGRPSGILGTTAYYAKETFMFLFMNKPFPDDPLESQTRALRPGQPLRKAVTLLERAAVGGNPDAMYLLGDLSFYGNFSHPRNYSEALRRYHQLASLNGNSTAQHMVGFIYATGIGGTVKRDQARALLYHTYAALTGDTRSEMTVAFRYHTGVGTPRNCDKAAFYYKRVADKAISHWRSGPPGGRAIPRVAYRLADEEGGVYGEGASVSSSGPNAMQGGPNSDAHAAFDDVLEYLDLMSRKGDLKATFSLGRLYYEGSRSMNKDLPKARGYFMLVAKKHWTRDGKTIPGTTSGVEKFAAKAAGYLGRMSLRGEGMEQSFAKAQAWFRRGVSHGDALSHNGMGLLYLNGYGVPKDSLRAAEYFKAAAAHDHAPAQVNLGKLFLDQGDVLVATQYFELAARHGYIEAFYYLAEIANRGVGRDRSCGMATAYYKIVAERTEEFHSSFVEANQAHDDGDLEAALLLYLMAAEQGYEVGQANVAYMLDEETSRLHLPSPMPVRKVRPALLRDPRLALTHWTRSAKQHNIDSMVKMGDYYLKGVGAEADDEKAATCYQAAAELQQSAQALWNMGWMHENGIGVQQDFHLAKRFYDLAVQTNSEAYLPVLLALVKLRARSFWNTVTNGRVNSIRAEPEPKQEFSFREWLNDFLYNQHSYDAEMEDEADLQDSMTDELAGPDDLYSDVIDDGIAETLIIVGLAAMLAFMVYFRQQRQLDRPATRNGQGDNAQQQQQQQQEQQQMGGAAGAGAGAGAPAPAPANEQDPEPQPQADPQAGPQVDRGLFPQPGDPEFAQWVAGGIAQ